MRYLGTLFKRVDPLIPDPSRTGEGKRFRGDETKKGGVYLGVKTCEVFLCFVAIVRVRAYYVDFFVFFVLRH